MGFRCAENSVACHCSRCRSLSFFGFSFVRVWWRQVEVREEIQRNILSRVLLRLILTIFHLTRQNGKFSIFSFHFVSLRHRLLLSLLIQVDFTFAFQRIESWKFSFEIVVSTAKVGVNCISFFSCLILLLLVCCCRISRHHVWVISTQRQI